MRILLTIPLLLILAQTGMAEFDVEPGELRANELAVTVGDEQQTVPFWLYIPDTYTAESAQDATFPLVLFLHGRGECGNGGDELQRATIHGPAKLIKQGRQFPFILVAPQCPAPEAGLTKTKVAWQPAQLLQLLDDVTGQLRVDEDRVYVTGLSMGGFGTWRLAAMAPQRFAAIIPICGGGAADFALPLKDMPIWAFHGQRDQVVPSDLSSEMVKQINNIGGQAKLTIYADANHDSWTRTYENDAVYEWLLSHRRSSAPQPE